MTRITIQEANRRLALHKARQQRLWREVELAAENFQATAESIGYPEMKTWHMIPQDIIIGLNEEGRQQYAEYILARDNYMKG